jgi:hypothetical protein
MNFSVISKFQIRVRQSTTNKLVLQLALMFLHHRQNGLVNQKITQHPRGHPHSLAKSSLFLKNFKMCTHLSLQVKE